MDDKKWLEAHLKALQLITLKPKKKPVKVIVKEKKGDR
jgi:hypothetical protein